MTSSGRVPGEAASAVKLGHPHVRTGRAHASLTPDKPTYAITSVDNALRLLDMLRSEGTIRVSDAANRIGVARSTAHRLLAMLCYRGFATRTDDHEYTVGWAIQHTFPEMDGSTQAHLRQALRPFLINLRRQLDETVHVMQLAGAYVRFLDSVECSQSVRVRTRAGSIMPAHLTSGGQAMLAELSFGELTRNYPAGPPTGVPQDLRQWFSALRGVQLRGYGINSGLSERGLTAVGAVVHSRDRKPVAAVCVSAPSVRLGPGQIPPTAAILLKVLADVESSGVLS